MNYQKSDKQAKLHSGGHHKVSVLSESATGPCRPAATSVKRCLRRMTDSQIICARPNSVEATPAVCPRRFSQPVVQPTLETASELKASPIKADTYMARCFRGTRLAEAYVMSPLVISSVCAR